MAGMLLLGWPQSLFNGGKSQGQSGIITGSADYPFLDYFKSFDTWVGTDTFNNNQKIDPAWLSADGWPNGPVINATSVSGNGVFVGGVLPPPASYTGTNGNMRLTWTVTGAGGSDTVGWSIQLMGVTTVSGSAVSTGNGTFSYIFTPKYDNPFNSLTFHLLLSGTAHVTTASLVFDGQDYTDWLAGKYFNRQFTSRISQARFGVWRFMDWLSTNVSNTSTWATRKSMSYVTWANDEYRANLSAGVTSGNVGNDYSITIPGTYVWSGPNGTYSTGGAAVDKQTMHMRFNADATYVANTQTSDGSGGSSTLTITAISPLTFNWPSLPLSNGDPLCIYVDGNGGNQIGGTSPNVVYYVVGVSGNTFKVALTSGGSQVVASDFGQGNAGITRLPTLKIDGTNKIPIMGPMASPISNLNKIPKATSNGTAQIWGTLTYDIQLNCWMMNGATAEGTGDAGLMNSAPIEACFALCKQLGMHPHWSLPGFALDPPTDYATSLATYCKTNNPGWMAPHYEPANEIWNPTPVTFYSAGKAFSYWGAAASLHDWYGMSLSLMGQGIASIYGAGNLGTTYEVMCGVKSDDGLNPAGGSENPRITTNQWTTQAQPTRSGYTISAASGWASSILMATYVNPSMRGTLPECLNAWQYFFVNGGVPSNTSAMQNLNNYADTLGGVSALPGNNAYWLARFQGFQTWAAGFGVNKMFAYEGGFSPDLIQGNGRDWQSILTAATNAAQCVLTLATTSGGDPGASNNGISGNPAQVGMCVWIGGASGMTQLNTTGASSGPTFTIGQSIISLANTFVANQGIVFTSNALFGSGTSLPTNLQPDTPYYILAASLTSSQFQIATTKGGTPIVFTAASGTTSVFANGGYLTGWIVTNVSGNSVTIDCNSSGFGTFTGSALADYAGSRGYVNNFRVQTLQYATNLPAQLKTNYDNFISAGGLYPSQYQLANGTSIWACINPDIFATPSQEFNMIAAYNS